MQANAPKPDPPNRKRRWLHFSLCLLVVIVTTAAVAAARLSTATTYTASALIRIATNEQPIAFKIDNTRTDFDIYKASQIQLLQSDFVLVAALRKISKLEILKSEDDPVRWLARSLQIENPGNSEIVRVSLTTPQKDDAVAILQAVVEAYVNEVVDKERAARFDRLAVLDRVYVEKETQLRSRWTELKILSRALGVGGHIESRIQPQITDLRKSVAEMHRAELQAELRVARAKHKLVGLADDSPEFKAAKSEADLAEVDREFWKSKSTPLTEEIDKLHKQLDSRSQESIDVEMMRGEVESLKAIVLALRDERYRDQVHLDYGSRITVVQPAL